MTAYTTAELRAMIDPDWRLNLSRSGIIDLTAIAIKIIGGM